MPNVSISLSEGNLELLDRLGAELGTVGRSETIRTAVRSLHDEVRGRKELTGEIEGVLIVVEDRGLTGEIDDVRHSAIVKAQVHSHQSDGRCMEVMLVSGKASEVVRMLDTLRSLSSFSSVRFVPL